MGAFGAGWRTELERAMEIDRALKRPPLVQVATVRADSRPANRTLVFRGFLEPEGALVFTTDSRSAKVGEANGDQPWAEACWYLWEAREQFRIDGTVSWISDGAAGAELETRRRIWSELSIETRRSFAWPTPLSPLGSSQAPAPAVSNLDDPPACFWLMVLNPRHVDHLELGMTPHRRRLHSLGDGGAWTVEEVNP